MSATARELGDLQRLHDETLLALNRHQIENVEMQGKIDRVNALLAKHAEHPIVRMLKAQIDAADRARTAELGGVGP